MTTAFTKAELKALLSHASTDKARTNLNGVCYRKVRDRLALVATDGHRVICRLVGEIIGAPEGTILPRALLERAHKLASAKDSIFFEAIVESDGRVICRAIIQGQPALEVPAVDGTYPDVDQVLPRSDGGTPDQWGVDGRYLADLDLVAKCVSLDHAISMRAPVDPLSPIPWSCGDEWRGVIMTMRV